MSDLYKEYRRLKHAKEPSCRDTVSKPIEESRDAPEVATAVNVFKEKKKNECRWLY